MRDSRDAQPRVARAACRQAVRNISWYLVPTAQQAPQVLHLDTLARGQAVQAIGSIKCQIIQKFYVFV